MLYSREDPLLDNLATKLGKLSSVGSQIVMSYIYDVNYGICQHEATIEPLSQVLMHEKETYGPNTPHSKSMRDFKRYRIRDTFGLDWLQWLDLPLDTAADMILICKESMDEEAHVQNKAVADLNATIAGKG